MNFTHGEMPVTSRKVFRFLTRIFDNHNRCPVQAGGDWKDVQHAQSQKRERLLDPDEFKRSNGFIRAFLEDVAMMIAELQQLNTGQDNRLASH